MTNTIDVPKICYFNVQNTIKRLNVIKIDKMLSKFLKC